ncbi:MAG: J domain-containing protein [Clostridiales bacterium]|nr:J domain-containing protein [Clostridiales bacterium]
MQSVFEILGVEPDADEHAIRSAYHQLAKSCHPDKFTDPEEQVRGQERLISINVAYEQAMRIAANRTSPAASFPLPQAKVWATKLIGRKQYELALLQLSKAEDKDAEWYALQAQTLVGLKQFISAHQAWRAAVRLDPDNLAYRRGALEAEMMLKRADSLPHRALSQIKNLFQKRN